MEKIKEMMFAVLSRTLSISEFENWLYSDPFVNTNILQNDLVWAILSINLKSKEAYGELQKVCDRYFDRLEFLFAVVENNAMKFLEDESPSGAMTFLSNVTQFYDWDDDYGLINQVKNIQYDWDLVLEGIYSKAEVLQALSSFIQSVLCVSDIGRIEEKRRVVMEGVEWNLVSPAIAQMLVNKNQNKKWYQFWK